MEKHSGSGIAALPRSSSFAGLRPPSQRRRILDAMIACCAEKTYAGTTIADLVRRGSVSRTTFYKLFTDKRDCFDAAVTLCIERLAATLAGAAAGGDSPAEATRRGPPPGSSCWPPSRS